MAAALAVRPALDGRAFAREVDALRKQIVAGLGPEDLLHLRRLERWGRLCTIAGYALAPWSFNPLAALLIALGSSTRWLLMHHIGHRGYDKVPGVPRRFTSGVFALGWRRFVDWFDWILPEAWNYEHNVLHHYHTGEAGDPDLVERTMAEGWSNGHAMPLRYATVVFFALTWKLSYYAPTTFAAAEDQARAKRGEAPIAAWWHLFNPFWSTGRAFFRRCVLPYGVARFIALPALFLPLGKRAAAAVLLNSLLAEIFANLHSFCVIVPNHAGDDLYRFDNAEKDKAEYYARQVMGSANYHCGNDLLDYAQIWLNYQIEHHLWPDLPMLQYQRWQPQLRALCERHGLPYVQQGVFRRVGKLVDVMVGRTRMRRASRLTE